MLVPLRWTTVPVTVEIPEASRLHEHQVLLDDDEEGLIRESQLDEEGTDDAPMVKSSSLLWRNLT